MDEVVRASKALIAIYNVNGRSGARGISFNAVEERAISLARAARRERFTKSRIHTGAFVRRRRCLCSRSFVFELVKSELSNRHVEATNWKASFTPRADSWASKNQPEIYRDNYPRAAVSCPRFYTNGCLRFKDLL